MKQSSAKLKMTAREILTGRWTTAVAVTCILSLVAAGALYLSWLFLSSMRRSAFMVFASIAVILIVSLMLLLFEAGVAYFFLKLGRTRDSKVSDLLYAFKACPDRILINGFLLTGVLVVYGIPYYIAFSRVTGSAFFSVVFLLVWSIIGTFLLIFILLEFSQFIFILLDDPDCGAIESLKKSARLMKGNKWRLFKVVFSFIGWFFLNLLSGGLGALWIRPYYTETLSLFYRSLKDEFTE